MLCFDWSRPRSRRTMQKAGWRIVSDWHNKQHGLRLFPDIHARLCHWRGSAAGCRHWTNSSRCHQLQRQRTGRQNSDIHYSWQVTGYSNWFSPYPHGFCFLQAFNLLVSSEKIFWRELVPQFILLEVVLILEKESASFKRIMMLWNMTWFYCFCKSFA